MIDHGQVIAHDTPHGLKRVVGGQRLTVHPVDPARYDDLVTVLSGIDGGVPEAEGRGSVTIKVDSDEVMPDVVARLRPPGRPGAGLRHRTGRPVAQYVMEFST